MNHRKRSDTVDRHRDNLRILLSIDEAAARVGCSRYTIRRRVADGTIRAVRFGPRLLRVDQADVDAALRPVPSAGSAA